MTPSAFRDLTPSDQIEMLAHRREFNWRKSHHSHVEKQVMDAENETNKNRNR